MKAIALVALCCGASVAASAAGQPSATCPSGPAVLWIADDCMAKIGTDDEIAASDCIDEQSKSVGLSDEAAEFLRGFF